MLAEKKIRIVKKPVIVTKEVEDEKLKPKDFIYPERKPPGRNNVGNRLSGASFSHTPSPKIVPTKRGNTYVSFVDTNKFQVLFSIILLTKSCCCYRSSSSLEEDC